MASSKQRRLAWLAAWRYGGSGSRVIGNGVWRGGVWKVWRRYYWPGYRAQAVLRIDPAARLASAPAPKRRKERAGTRVSVSPVSFRRGKGGGTSMGWHEGIARPVSVETLGQRLSSKRLPVPIHARRKKRWAGSLRRWGQRSGSGVRAGRAVGIARWSKAKRRAAGWVVDAEVRVLEVDERTAFGELGGDRIGGQRPTRELTAWIVQCCARRWPTQGGAAFLGQGCAGGVADWHGEASAEVKEAYVVLVAPAQRGRLPASNQEAVPGRDGRRYRRRR